MTPPKKLFAEGAAPAKCLIRTLDTFATDGWIIINADPHPQKSFFALRRITLLGKEMSRYRVIIAEFATGIVRRVDSPAKRHLKGQGGEMSRVFESEDEALAFKDAVLREFEDLEVIVRPEDADRGGCRFYIEGGRQIADSFDQHQRA